MKSAEESVAIIRKQLLDASDIPELNRVLRKTIVGYGFDAYAMGYLPDAPDAASRHPFLMIDWPTAWLELYARRGFATDDVVVAEAARTSEPFTWTEVRGRYPDASREIFAAAADFGWSDGFAIPVHDPKGRSGETFGVVSLAAKRLDGFDQPSRTFVVATALAAFGAAKALFDRPNVALRLQLSGREDEALKLVADGFSDEDIARHLGITRRTAHHHVESAKRRLGATSRAQAVAIALTNGLLGARRSSRPG